MEKRCYICGSSRHLCGKCPRQFALPDDCASLPFKKKPSGRRYSDYGDKQDSFQRRASRRKCSLSPSPRGSPVAVLRRRAEEYESHRSAGRRVKRFCTICQRYGHGTRDCWYNRSVYMTRAPRRAYEPRRHGRRQPPSMSSMDELFSAHSRRRNGRGETRGSKWGQEIESVVKVDGKAVLTDGSARKGGGRGWLVREPPVQEKVVFPSPKEPQPSSNETSGKPEQSNGRMQTSGEEKSENGDLSTCESDDFESERSLASSSSESAPVSSFRRPRRERQQLAAVPGQEGSDAESSGLTPPKTGLQNGAAQAEQVSERQWFDMKDLEGALDASVSTDEPSSKSDDRPPAKRVIRRAVGNGWEDDARRRDCATAKPKGFGAKQEKPYRPANRHFRAVDEEEGEGQEEEKVRVCRSLYPPKMSFDRRRRHQPAEARRDERWYGPSKRTSRAYGPRRRLAVVGPSDGIGLIEVYSASEVTCYNCGRTGHKSFDCPESGINRQRLR